MSVCECVCVRERGVVKTHALKSPPSSVHRFLSKKCPTIFSCKVLEVGSILFDDVPILEWCFYLWNTGLVTGLVTPPPCSELVGGTYQSVIA